MCQDDINEIPKHDYDQHECNIKSFINMNIINIMVCSCNPKLTLDKHHNATKPLINGECHINNITLDLCHNVT